MKMLCPQYQIRRQKADGFAADFHVKRIEIPFRIARWNLYGTLDDPLEIRSFSIK